MSGLPKKLQNSNTSSVFRVATIAILVMIFFISFCLAYAFAFAAPANEKEHPTGGQKELVQLGHFVQKGETLDDIAKLYCPPEQAKHAKGLAEFKEGIYEYNYEKVFYARPKYEVRPGDFLTICLFVVVDYD